MAGGHAQRRLQRAEENAAAFDDIGQLRTVNGDTVAVLCREAGADRVILARHTVDESDGYTDYYGGRTTRTVVIGFGKGKRENFRQLRKAAAAFSTDRPPGPGPGEVRVWVEPPAHDRARLHTAHRGGPGVRTAAEAEAWIAARDGRGMQRREPGGHVRQVTGTS